VIAYRNAPPLADIVKRMVEDAERNDRRDRTIGEIRWRLETFAEDFPDRRLSEITVEEIEEWLDEEDWSARSRINYLTKISQLYNYALRHKWVDANVAERIERPTAEDKEPGIFTIAQAENLLRHAGEHGLLPYISIGLFAGLRSAELMRLDWSAVNLQEKAIVVGAAVAKKRSRRVVEICEALEGWLRLCVQETGMIVDGAKFKENMDELKTAAGIEEWPHNGLRHSYGSYHLAAFGDQVKTAAQMGHRDSTVIHNHYKALVLKSEAEKYWKLLPKTEEAGQKGKPPKAESKAEIRAAIT
jgi:integrase